MIQDLSIVIVGASGDLARKKIFPALFALYCQGFLPASLRMFGFARTNLSHDAFRALISEHLACRYGPSASCGGKTGEFLDHCFYTAGNYDSRESFLDLYELMRREEPGSETHRCFYLAIPPSVFLDTARAMAGAGLIACGPDRVWSRVVIEKPFGHDRASSDLLTHELSRVFSEEQTYRIDHYLGKEVTQNLLVLRFANLIFEPLWNRHFIESVHIDWKEDIGVGNRAGYFNEYGIIRDVVQNHLLQILALVAMEKPASMKANDIRDAKVRVLKAIPPVTLDDIIIGQYQSTSLNGKLQPGYLEEKGVPPDSITPTYASTVLSINNDRWQGVPFVITAGKALDSRVSHVRIKFRNPVDGIFCNTLGCPAENDLIIRIQPDESIFLNIVCKEPGLNLSLVKTSLNLRYQSAFEAKIPEAYERLLLDVIAGDKSLFIRSDELSTAWDIFTPVLKELATRHIRPEPYAIGSTGPTANNPLRGHQTQ